MRPPPTFGDLNDSELINNLYSEYKDIANKNNVNYIDLYTSLISFIDEMNQMNYYCDTVHPFNNLNLKIAHIISENILKTTIDENLKYRPILSSKKCYCYDAS